MRRILTATLVFGIALICGCGGSSSSRLIGDWQMSTEQAADSTAETKDGSKNARWLDRRVGEGSSPGSMTIRFEKNGTLATKTDFAMAQGAYVGNWRLVKADDDGKTVYIACELKGDKIQTKITFIDDDTILMIPPNLVALEKEIMFRRQPK
jgi:hypothetical protein